MMAALRIFILSILFLTSAWSLPDPDKILNELLAGNNRFATNRCKNTHCETQFREKTASGQEPIAIILGCSDSRVPAEIIFDQGLGKLFIVRDAGNVVGNIELASIEFAVTQLHVPLIIVLGHQECGAVKTVLKESEQDAGLRDIYPLIASAIAECKMEGEKALTKAIYCNITKSMQTLKSSPILSKCLEQKKLKIVGGYYDFISGKVNIIR